MWSGVGLDLVAQGQVSAGVSSFGGGEVLAEHPDRGGGSGGGHRVQAHGSRARIVGPGPCRVRASRDEDFAAFMAGSQVELLRRAWLPVGDADRAEELTQQALVRTYGAWPRAQRDPVAYTRRVLVNLRTDTWRRRRREVPMAPERVPERAAADDDGLGNRDQLSRVLAVLTSRQRRVVVLRYLLDLPEADVAADLGVSVGTVKSTASRALAQLRSAIRNESGKGGADGRAD